MLGAIAGDMIGSIYEWNPIKTKNFPLLGAHCRFTDDTVLTVATADVLLHGGTYAERYREYARRYPQAGYGASFQRWAQAADPKPYGSFGNGSAMRVSAVGWALSDLPSVWEEAKHSAEATHNHPEGIKGAQATAAAVFLGRQRAAKEEMKAYLQREFSYDLSRTLEEIRPPYRFDVTCQGTLPATILCFLESTGYEDAIRNAISLGGDSDTLACITGAMAEAFYGPIPHSIAQWALEKLDAPLRVITEEFRSRFMETA